MAWNDGSRFLIASGVKWGSGPKVYKGSSKDTEWNKDLLWRLYVQGETKRYLAGDNAPPFMMPLKRALAKKPLHFYDPFSGDPAKTCQDEVEDSQLRQLKKKMAFPHLAKGPRRGKDIGAAAPASSRSRAGSRRGGASRGPGTPPSSRRIHAAAAAAHMGHSKSSGAISLASARSRASARPSTSRSNAAATTSARLARIEEALMMERAQRQQVESKLKNMEKEMHSTQQMQARLQKYETIMGTLMQSVREADKRRK